MTNNKLLLGFILRFGVSVIVIHRRFRVIGGIIVLTLNGIRTEQFQHAYVLVREAGIHNTFHFQIRVEITSKNWSPHRL